jgi:hypothetical protein
MKEVAPLSLPERQVACPIDAEGPIEGQATPALGVTGDRRAVEAPRSPGFLVLTRKALLVQEKLLLREMRDARFDYRSARRVQ